MATKRTARKPKTFELDLGDQCHIDALDYLAASLERNGRPDDAVEPRKLAADANTLKTEAVRLEQRTADAEADVEDRAARARALAAENAATDEGD